MPSCYKRTSLEGKFPEQLAGIDLLSGLELLSGNRALYLDLLHKFLDGHRDVSSAVRRALAAGEWDVAKLMVHNTKGVCACIGANVLQESAAALEWAITTQSFELDTLLHQFEATLNEVMSDLASKLPSLHSLQPAEG